MSPNPTGASKSALGVIFLTIFIDLVGFGIVIPLLPTYVTRLSASPALVGFVMASFTLMQFIFSPIMGRLSDQYGRRPFILMGLAGSFVSYLMFAFASSLAMLLASRLLAGLFNANVAVGQAYIADVTSPEERSKGMGMIGAAFGMGFTFGPVIGGVSGGLAESHLGMEWGYRMPGLVAAGFSVFALVWAWFRLPESHPPERRRAPVMSARRFDLGNLKRALSHPVMGILLALFFMEVFAFANFESSFVLFGDKKWQLTKIQAGLYIGYIGIVSATVQGALIGRLTRRFGEATLLKAGLLSLGIGLALIPLSPSANWIFLTAAPVPLGIGLINPTIPSLISRIASPEERGGLLGISQGVGSLGRIAGQPFGTVMFEKAGMAAPFFSGAVMMLLAFGAALAVIPRRK